MARFSFRLPDIGEGISEAEIVAWHVAVGDRVEEDGRLADMMTDKATVEMESPVAGTVVELAGEPGDQVAIGATLVVIETAEEMPSPITSTLRSTSWSARRHGCAIARRATSPRRSRYARRSAAAFSAGRPTASRPRASLPMSAASRR